MSLAGVRSTGGDIYQICVAMEWAIEMIIDPNLAWIEVDSTRLIRGSIPAPVDDVIVGKLDGNEICCQCKIDAPGSKAWEVLGLKGDIHKAAIHLCADPMATVRFYSAAPFGDLKRLVTRVHKMHNEAAFENGFPANLSKSLADLKEVWASELKGGSYTTFDLLKRIAFHSTDDVGDYQAKNKRSLAQFVTRAEEAYEALWNTLQQLGARMIPAGDLAGSHRISRDEVLELLRDKGCIVSSPKALVDIERKFARMSQIGRAWHRSVADKTIPRQSVNALLDSSRANSRVLLTDGPGAGKTCILLDLVDELERQSDIATLFLQAREFAEASDQHGREALGLEPNIDALVSSLSERKRVVVVIDSLDVLSVNSDSNGLTFFVNLITTLSRIRNVCVIAACRSFDVKYNRKLSVLDWDYRIEAGLLDWETEVAPLLQEQGVQTGEIDAVTRALLANPRNLSLFVDLGKRSSYRNVATAQELIEAYLDAVVSGDPNLGTSAMVAIEKMASEMLSARRYLLPRSQVDVDDGMLLRLLSVNVLHRGDRPEVGFGHQTLLDALAIRGAVRSRLRLFEFINTLRPVPFVRPAIRAFFEYLRAGDRQEFRLQVREVFASNVPFHIKRLIAESYARCEPEQEDWHLLRYLFREHEQHFRSIYGAAESLSWHRFWMGNLVPLLWQTRDAAWLGGHFTKLRQWANDDPETVVAYWTQVATSPFAKSAGLRGRIAHVMSDFKKWDQVDAQTLLQALVDLPAGEHDFMGNVLLRWAKQDPRGDELVWRYVTCDVPLAPKNERQVEDSLHCDETRFRGDQQLPSRIGLSDVLLDLAVTSIESWGYSVSTDSRSTTAELEPAPNNAFLNKTTYDDTHSIQPIRRLSSFAHLVRGVEAAILERAKQGTSWWQANARRICLNDCGALRYMGILAMTRFPEENIECAQAFFTSDKRLECTDNYELGHLIAATAPYLGNAIDLVEQHILRRHSILYPVHAGIGDSLRYQLLRKIPSMLRSAVVTEFILKMDKESAPPLDQPDIHFAAGMLNAPYSEQQVAALSDPGLAQLVDHSQALTHGPQALMELSGAAVSVDRLIHNIASAEPRRYLRFITRHWGEIPETTKVALLSGATDYLRYRYADLSNAHWKPREEVSAEELTELLLNELERNSQFWTGTSAGARAVGGCAVVVRSALGAQRVAFLACTHIAVEDPVCSGTYDDDLGTVAINSSRGLLAEGLVILTKHLLQDGMELPELLTPTLLRLARDCHPAVRAAVIEKLAFIQSKTELGWELFDVAFSGADERVWTHAAETLYYATGKQAPRAKPYLDLMEASKVGDVRKAWGRLAALAVLRGEMNSDTLLEKLIAGASADAWEGAVVVWVANAHRCQFIDECLAGLRHATKHPLAKQALARHVGHLFQTNQSFVQVPLDLFKAFKSADGEGVQIIASISPWLGEWLCQMVEFEPDDAVLVAEMAAEAALARNVSPFNDPDTLGTLMTALFREAEERERSDEGAMLARVIALQDAFLSMPTADLSNWLRAAERPAV